MPRPTRGAGWSMTMAGAHGPSKAQHAGSRHDPHRHVPVLDGLRGIAILMVVLFHTTVVQPGPFVDSLLFYTFRSWGWAGVDLFFVLSGFLITGGLCDTKATSPAPHPPRYFRNFYARRILRIFPVYYGYLLLFTLLVPGRVVDQVGGDLVFFWLYLQNFAVISAGDFVHTHFLDHFWSLAVEEQWYLVWPFVVLLTTRRQLAWVCAGLVALSLALRITLLVSGVSPYAIHVLTPARLDGLAIGSILALAARRPGGLRRLVPSARVVAIASAAGLVALAGLQRGLLFYTLPGTLSVGFTLLALLFGALLVLSVEARSDGMAARALSSRLLARFGRYSYAIYVVHEAVRVVFSLALQRYGIRPYQPQPGWLGPQLLLYAGVIGLSFLVAALSWRFYERPILGLKRFFPTRSALTPPS